MPLRNYPCWRSGDVKDKQQRESGHTAYKPCLKEPLVLILGQPPSCFLITSMPICFPVGAMSCLTAGELGGRLGRQRGEHGRAAGATVCASIAPGGRANSTQYCAAQTPRIPRSDRLPAGEPRCPGVAWRYPGRIARRLARITWSSVSDKPRETRLARIELVNLFWRAS